MRPVSCLLLALSVALTLAACAPNHAETLPTLSTATPIPRPTHTPAPTTSTTSGPSAETPTPRENGDAFTVSELADTCITAVTETQSGGSDKIATPRRSEARGQQLEDGRWGVAVPVSMAQDGRELPDVTYLCTASGNRNDFHLEMHAVADYTVGSDWVQVLFDVEEGRR